MAVTGTFLADFANFNTAVEASDLKLRGFQANAEKVESQLARVGNAFSGQRVIQEATLMAEAIHRAGGTSTLTATELERVGRVAAEAAEKMRALGLDVPEGIQKLADSAKDAAPAVEGLGARVTGLVAAYGVARGAASDLIAIGSDWVAQAVAQENATARLETALRSQGTYTPELAAQYGTLASAFQATTVYGDEMIAELQATLVTIGGVLPTEMKRAVTATTDLASALRIDLPSAGLLMARALEGNFTMLARKGIVIDELKFKTEGASAVFDAIAAKMGGAATAQAATFGGQMSRLSNQIGDVKESLGGMIASGLTPAVELFQRLPDSVENGVIAFGLLLAGAAALAVAVAGVSAAVALALPLLGMTTAVGGAAAVTSLGAAAGSAALGFVPLAAAIAAVWAAWELGNTVEVRDSIAEWALSSDDLLASLTRSVTGIEQVSNAEARASLAAMEAADGEGKLSDAVGEGDTTRKAAGASAASYASQLAALKAEVALLDAATKSEILAAKEMGASEKALEAQFGVNALQVAMLTKELTANEAATKKAASEAEAAAKTFAANLAEVNAAGTDWRETLRGVDAATIAYGQHLQAQGVSAAAVAQATGLNVVQLKALTLATREQVEADKLLAAQQQVNVRLSSDLNAIRGTQGKTATDQQIADVHRWAAELTAQLEAAGTATAANMALLGEIVAAELQGIAVDYEAINDTMTVGTRAGLQQIADRAQATYQEALLHVHEFSDKTILDFQQVAIEAQLAADSFGTGFEEAAAQATEAVTGMATQATAALTGMWDTALGPGPGERSLPGGGGYLGSGEGISNYGASGFLGRRAYRTDDGPSLFTPDRYSINGGAGTSINNTFNLVDTESNLARKVGEIVTRNVLAGRKVGA